MAPALSMTVFPSNGENTGVWEKYDLYDETQTPEGNVLQMGFMVFAPTSKNAHVCARIHFHILLRGIGWVWYDPQGKQQNEGGN